MPPDPDAELRRRRNFRRRRTIFTVDQLNTLQKIYERSPFITRDVRVALSQKLNLNERTIKVWFQNARMKSKLFNMVSGNEGDVGYDRPLYEGEGNGNQDDTQSNTLNQESMQYETSEDGYVYVQTYGDEISGNELGIGSGNESGKPVFDSSLVMDDNSLGDSDESMSSISAIAQRVQEPLGW